MATGNKSIACPLHDTNTQDVISCGFVPDLSGSFEGQFRQDSSDRTITVIGGAFYPFDVKVAKLAGATGTVSELLIIEC